MEGVGDPVLLHAGGWDEILLIAVPIALFVLFRWLASRREGADPDEGEEGRVAPSLLVAVGGLVVVGVVIGVVVPSSDGDGATTEERSGTERTLLGLCAASEAAVSGNVEGARDAFFGRSHQGLHDLADRASDEDRATAASLLEAKQRVESMLREGASAVELGPELGDLLGDARDAARAVDVTPPPCPEGD